MKRIVPKAARRPTLQNSNMDDLDKRLLAAHEAGDHRALVTLYATAADAATKQEAMFFYLTHAYVFALEQGHPDDPALHARLKAYGREE